MLFRVSSRLGAGFDVEFVEDVLNMSLGGSGAEEKPLSNLAIRASIDQETQHLEFARCQTVSICGPRLSGSKRFVWNGQSLHDRLGQWKSVSCRPLGSEVFLAKSISCCQNGLLGTSMAFRLG